MRFTMQTFVAGVTTANMAAPADTSVAAVLPDSSPGAPIVLLISPGTDPAADILQLAKAHGPNAAASGAEGSGGRQRHSRSVKVTLISLGRGQSATAEAAINEGAEKGHWVRLRLRACMRACRADDDKRPGGTIFTCGCPAPKFPRSCSHIKAWHHCVGQCLPAAL